MNLFNKLAGRFRAQNREAKAAEGIAPTVVKPKGPPPYIVQDRIKVPVGYVLPLGEAIKEQFWLVMEAGVRWHPEWEEPRITVNLWRMFPLGDALGWTGSKVLEFKRLLPADVVALTEFHGQTVTPESQKLLDRMGLEVPKVQQTLATFNSFRQAA